MLVNILLVISIMYRFIRSETAEQFPNSGINNEQRIKRQLFQFGDEDKYLNTTELITKYGHPVEEYSVTTEDGYILDLYRIPRPGPVVFLFHGLLCSSDDLLTNGPYIALPYLLSNSSYDMWLGNARGNKYSRKHVRFSTKQKEYWEFSWNEIGYFDLPAIIDFALATSGRSQLVYIGHSQATTAFFVLCSQRPEYNDKFLLAFSLGTGAYLWLAISSERLLAPFEKLEDSLAYGLGLYQLFPPGTPEILTASLCDSSGAARLVCLTVLFTVIGFDYRQVNSDRISVQLAHFPSSISTRQMIHYFQSANSKRFAQFDYGLIKNLEVYGSVLPPRYPVEKITAPVSIFYADNDYLSRFEDVKILIAELPNVVDSTECLTINLTILITCGRGMLKNWFIQEY